jgi:hypothetical protein
MERRENALSSTNREAQSGIKRLQAGLYTKLYFYHLEVAKLIKN